VRAGPRVIQVWDTAFQQKSSADYSVCSTWARTPQGVHVLDVVRERLEFPDLKRLARDLFNRWRPSVVLVEDKASGQSLVQELGRPSEHDPSRCPRLPVLAVKVEQDKVSRATAVTPYVEAGMVHLPESAPWVADWIEEHAVFPNGAYDDQVDTTSMALGRLLGVSGATLPFGWYRSSATFRAEVLGTPAPRPTGADRPTEPATEPGAQAPTGLPYQWLRPGGPSAMTPEERQQQRWLDLVEGRGWRD
jgi:predicted phage terminase large subunit-like protein